MTAATASARSLRLIAIGVALGIAVLVFALRNVLSSELRAGLGIICFIAIVASLSTDLRRVNWRTVLWGIALQLVLALFILKFEVGGRRPGYEFFAAIARGVGRFLEFTNAGSSFVFGVLANQTRMGETFGPDNGFVFAFTALPTIIFISSFFTVLYYFGVLQLIVRLMARAMMRVMGTSGAETLSAAANVFMGQTEAPIIVKPYIPLMTRSELLAMMAGGAVLSSEPAMSSVGTEMRGRSARRSKVVRRCTAFR